MQPIATAFDEKGFHYTQVERHGALAIYRQQRHGSHIIRFEVVKLRVESAHTWPNGALSPEREAYPRTTRWGSEGWTCHTLPQAQAILAEKQRGTHGA